MELKIKRLRCVECSNVFDAPEEPGPQFCSALCRKRHTVRNAPPDRADGFYRKITPGDFLLCQPASINALHVLAFALPRLEGPYLVRAVWDDGALLYVAVGADSWKNETHILREWPRTWIWKPVDWPLFNN